MNASPPPPPAVDVVVEEKTTTSSGGVSWMMIAIAVIPIIFTLVFHAGAASLSYQRNQSFLWATLHFFFAVFYYPYYAFTQPPAPVESSILPTFQSAGRKLQKMLTGKRK